MFRFFSIFSSHPFVGQNEVHHLLSRIGCRCCCLSRPRRCSLHKRSNSSSTKLTLDPTKCTNPKSKQKFFCPKFDRVSVLFFHFSHRSNQVEEGIELGALENIPGNQRVDLYSLLGSQFPIEVVQNLQRQIDSVGNN